MRLRILLQTLFRRQDGSTIVIAALSLSFMIGCSALVLDLGAEYNEASKLQNALDSAVLAAARSLPAENTDASQWTNAKDIAIQYLGLNEAEYSDAVTIDPIYKNGSAADGITGIQITSTIQVDYNFAGVFGPDQGSLTRSAAAELKIVNAMAGLVPLCITENSMRDIQAGTTKVLKFGSQLDETDQDGFYISSGWFGIVQLDGTGANEYREDFINGCTAVVSAGDVLGMQCGNLSGPTQQSYNTRIQGHVCCTYEHHEKNCPKIMTIPVVKILANKEIEVVGFASFFMEGLAGNGNDSIVTATYLDLQIQPGSVSGGAFDEYGDFGVYVVKLTG